MKQNKWATIQEKNLHGFVQTNISHKERILSKLTVSPNLEHKLSGKWRTTRTIYSQNAFMQCACAATDFRCNEILCFVNASGRNFSPIFTKFGTRIAEVIFKAEFVCERKRKYFARMRGSRIFVFFAPFSVFLPRDALVHSGIEIVCRPSVRLWRWWIRIT